MADKDETYMDFSVSNHDPHWRSDTFIKRTSLGFMNMAQAQIISFDVRSAGLGRGCVWCWLKLTLKPHRIVAFTEKPSPLISTLTD